MKKNVLLLSLCLILSVSLNAQFWKKKEKHQPKITTPIKRDKAKSYDETLKGFKTKDGLFKIHTKDEKLYLEIPISLFDRDFLLSSRVSAISDNKETVAGQLPKAPIMINFSKDNANLYMHEVNTFNICDKNSNSYESLKRNYLNPIIKTFPIKTMSLDSTAVVIDVTNFFTSDESSISLFSDSTPFDSMFGVKKMSGSIISNDCKILKVKSFPKNINIRSRMSYRVSGQPFVAELTRSIIILPKEPMKIRYADSRIGYFSERKRLFDENNDKVKFVNLLNRWRIEPKPEDLSKYKRGELVVPKKQIIWYVDSAIPEKYRAYIKQGIEDWQPVFEKIGFKDAIVARDFPTKEENPDFDPDDIRYSCYRYVTTSVANSMGPSWVDPRSGEILVGDVLFYSNVTKLLNSWRFVQTAQCDPSVRGELLPIEKMGESLRYVAAHEVGHTLGLMHNMGSSSAIPVEKLRDPEFTQKYGTTYSIMDYARNNYVAQPGDMERGVKLTPPNMGIYDEYAIAWGYTPIFNANTPEDEYETLNKWILDKANDKRFHYGPQQFFLNFLDPASNSEDLGDNSIESGRYGIKNLKYIASHLRDWTTIKNKDYSRLSEVNFELFVQFKRYIGHASKYLGGFNLYDCVGGENRTAYKAIDKKTQKDALNFIFENLRDLPNWYGKDVFKYFKPTDNSIGEYIKQLTTYTLSPTVTAHISWEEKSNPKTAYKLVDYMDDVYDKVFEKAGQNLNFYERLMQYTYLRTLLIDSDLIKINGSRSNKSISLAIDDYDNTIKTFYPYERMGIDINSLVKQDNEADVKSNMNPIYLYELNKAFKLCKNNLNKGDKETRIHYQNLYDQLKRVLQ